MDPPLLPGHNTGTRPRTSRSRTTPSITTTAGPSRSTARPPPHIHPQPPNLPPSPAPQPLLPLPPPNTLRIQRQPKPKPPHPPVAYATHPSRIVPGYQADYIRSNTAREGWRKPGQSFDKGRNDTPGGSGRRIRAIRGNAKRLIPPPVAYLVVRVYSLPRDGWEEETSEREDTSGW
jgi:hypothetical protein